MGASFSMDFGEEYSHWLRYEGCFLSPASNPTQLNNFAQLRVCEFGYGAGGEEIELSYNVEAGKTTPDRHQCGSVGGGEETVREVCAGWEWRGFGNWSERMENDGSCVRMRNTKTVANWDRHSKLVSVGDRIWRLKVFSVSNWVKNVGRSQMLVSFWSSHF